MPKMSAGMSRLMIYRHVSDSLANRIIRFCSKHGLTPSVKAGGYGTAGWAIGGDIILDVSKIIEMSIEPPNSNGGYTSLRDSAPRGSKGKGSTSINTSASGKRRREGDDNLRTYDSASKTVAAFMKGPLPSEDPDIPPPSMRRRLNAGPESDVPLTANPLPDSARHDKVAGDPSPGSASAPNTSSAQASLAAVPSICQVGSASSSSSSLPTADGTDRSRTQLSTTQGDTSTSATSPPPLATYYSTMLSSNTYSPIFTNESSQTLYQPSASLQSMMLRSFGPSTSALLSGPGLVASPYARLTTSEPIHKHAYVTFGAGMRQKEIDQYTAQNPLEGTSLTGEATHIPYHVPL